MTEQEYKDWLDKEYERMKNHKKQQKKPSNS